MSWSVAHSVSESAFWQDAYERGFTPWDMRQPAPPFVAWLAGPEAPPRGRRVAMLGCGDGHEAILFQQHGHEVTGFDFAPAAIERARSHAQETGVCPTFVQADVFALPESFTGAFDLLVEHCCFCAVDPARRADYVDVAARLVRPGGGLVGLFYAHGRPGGPPYTTSADEVRRLFEPAFEILRLEPALDSHPRRAGTELFAEFRRQCPSPDDAKCEGPRGRR